MGEASHKVDKRIDEMGFGTLRIKQNPKAFCYGVDAVLLADFAARDAAPRRIADLGTGSGAVPLILSHKTYAESIIGIELQQESFKLFEENIELNSLQNRLKAINIDIIDLLASYPKFAGSFDCVTSNPPYFKRAAAIPSANIEKRIARHETSAGVHEFIFVAGKLLSERGAFYMIHRPARLPDIFDACGKAGMCMEVLQMVATDEKSAPSMVLVKATKGKNRELKVLKTLYIYEKTRDYTEEIQKIYER